eukprot:430202_1
MPHGYLQDHSPFGSCANINVIPFHNNQPQNANQYDNNGTMFHNNQEQKQSDDPFGALLQQLVTTQTQYDVMSQQCQAPQQHQTQQSQYQQPQQMQYVQAQQSQIYTQTLPQQTQYTNNPTNSHPTTNTSSLWTANNAQTVSNDLNSGNSVEADHKRKTPHPKLTKKQLADKVHAEMNWDDEMKEMVSRRLVKKEVCFRMAPVHKEVPGKLVVVVEALFKGNQCKICLKTMYTGCATHGRMHINVYCGLTSNGTKPKTFKYYRYATKTSDNKYACKMCNTVLISH